MNVKFIRKFYLESEKYSQLECRDQNRRKKYKLYYTNIVWGYELDLAQNLEYRVGCTKRDTESLVLTTV
jgi:hypothetical protein